MVVRPKVKILRKQTKYPTSNSRNDAYTSPPN